MTQKPLNRIQREGHYLGGLFHQFTIFGFVLRALLDLVVVILTYLLFFRVAMRLNLFRECFWNCFTNTDAVRCPFSLDALVAIAGVGAASLLVSTVLTVGTKEKLFLRSSLLTGLLVVTALLGGLYFQSSFSLVALYIPVAFSSMYVGYRTGLVVRRKRRKRSEI